MKYVAKVVMLALLATSSAFAQTFTWVAPTQNTDLSPITAAEITTEGLGYRINVRDTTVAGSVAGTYTYKLQIAWGTLTATASQFSPALPVGHLLAAAMQTDTAAGFPDSAFSPEVTFTIPAPVLTPNAPSGFAVH
jgi:hypothetical protein